MIEIINRYSHGYIFVSVVHALNSKGFFRFEPGGEAFLHDCERKNTRVNIGYLNAAMKMLDAIGWIERQPDDHYLLTPSHKFSQCVPDNIMQLYHFPFDNYFKGKSKQSLTSWIDLSINNWHCVDERFAHFLDGVLIIPLLLTLKKLNLIELTKEGSVQTQLTFDLPEGQVSDDVIRYFINKEWVAEQGGQLLLTSMGSFVIDRIFTTAALASYKPMICGFEHLLFGDTNKVFGRTKSGHEKHLDRSLNVIGSGFQHQKYFKELINIIVELFDNDDFERQPRYVCDMGCGNGELLKGIYQAIAQRTKRGQHLDKYPLKLIATDFNEKALSESRKTLKGIEHIVIKGDIADPHQLIIDLKASGIEDTQNILHVRSFLDHDRPYIVPKNLERMAERSNMAYQGSYIKANGDVIAATEVIQSTVEHLHNWASIDSRFGLILLEVHCLSALAAGEFVDESESFHFDAYHAFSKQYLVEAEQFVLCAAEVGLFPRKGFSKQYPTVMDFTRITLNFFEKRPYILRMAKISDLAAAAQMNVLAGNNDISSLHYCLDKFPECQFTIEKDGELVAVVLFDNECLEDKSAKQMKLVKFSAQTSLPAKDILGVIDFIILYFDIGNSVRKLIGLEQLVEAVSERVINGQACEVAVAKVKANIAASPELQDNPLVAEHEIAEFAFSWLLNILHGKGVLDQQQDRPAITVAEIKDKLNVDAKYDKYFAVMIDKLCQRDLLVCDQNKFTFSDAAYKKIMSDPNTQLYDFQLRLSEEHPQYQGFLAFVATCMERYEDIISGKVDAIEVLFSGADDTVFAEIFHGDQVSDYFNGIVADAIAAFVDKRLANGEPLSILEVGAGTGSATLPVLQQLAKQDVSQLNFMVTDISQAFNRITAKKFDTQFPWVNYAVLNIENVLLPQGFAESSFDVIFSTNVLHNTKTLEHTLAQVRRLLKPGGLFVINEFTHLKDFLMCCGALLHGYWLFEDPENRLHGTCLASIEQWQDTLAKVQLQPRGVHILPSQQNSEIVSQGVILCENVKAVDVLDLDETEIEDVQAGSGAAEGFALNGTRQGIEGLIEQDVLELLGAKRESNYGRARPIMEMGFDSLELVELKSLIGKHFDLKLSPTYFFEFETVEAIAESLVEQLPESVLACHSNTDGKFGEQSISAPLARSDAVTEQQNYDIAVIGMACRLPGEVEDYEQFWRLLESGQQVVNQMSNERFEWPEDIDPQTTHKGIDKGGYLNRIDEFDAEFFRISPKEAELMDPQQRLLMMLTWQAFEDAGITPSSVRGGDIGVFIGACHDDYKLNIIGAGLRTEPYFGTGNAFSILSNRLSYFFDLKGCSITYDTACSSSMVALDGAVEKLQRGECSQALVGGVNLVASPQHSCAYYRSGMLSKDSRCATFDARANGYARGEGSVVMLLKRLSDAIADKDNIHAVIKAVSVSHGGQAASLTAPKPDAQANLIEKAYKKAGIAPEHIGYIEAHGTATPLGDPVEINGLNQGFKRLFGAIPGQKQYCALGSVKTNIGHLEGAAGVAGLLKTVLMLKQQKLLSNAGFQTLNPELSLSDSPFYVLTQNEDWQLVGNAQKRIAGVSSFGFGGAIAHAVVAESDIQQDLRADIQSPIVVVLSALNETRLVAYCRKLHDFVASKEMTPQALRDMAYTLQVGRENMMVRLAFVVENQTQLKAQLTDVINGQIKPHSPAKVNNKAVNSSELPKITGETLLSQLQHGQQNMLDMWARSQVEIIDWLQLYGNNMPRRICLPTYCFAKERYWCRATGVAKQTESHLLLRNMTVVGNSTRFETRFNGSEFFLSDHQIDGKPLLPAVVYLSMIECAISQKFNRKPLALHNIVWSQKCEVTEGEKKLQVELQSGSSFAIHSLKGSEKVLHSSGEVEQLTDVTTISLDIETLSAQCRLSTMSRQQCYKLYSARGIDYGPGHQSVEHILIGQNQLLAKVCVPQHLQAEAGLYHLHPSVMDGALQVIIGLENKTQQSQTYLPFGLNELRVFKPCNGSHWVSVRKVPSLSKKNQNSQIQRFDIAICDLSGEVCVELIGYTTRANGTGTQSDAEQQGKTHILLPKWQEKALENGCFFHSEHFILATAGFSSSDAQTLAATADADEMFELLSHGNMMETFSAGFTQVFERLKQLFQQKPKAPVQFLLVCKQTADTRCLEALAGLLKTAALENSQLLWQIILVDAELSTVDIAKKVKANRQATADTLIVYKGQQRYVRTWQPVEVPKNNGGMSCWRDSGTYLISGGAGALGLAVARDIAKYVNNANIILLGRSLLNENISLQLTGLRQLGVNASYQTCDIQSSDAVLQLKTFIEQEFGNLNGLIHCAGVIRDNYILNKSLDETSDVLAAKVLGLMNLDHLVDGFDLDLFVLYSSTSAVLGNAGQSDYAAANSFMDSYASYRTQAVEAGHSKGTTLSINWPYWAHGGMEINQAMLDRMFNDLGMLPMSDLEGMAALHGAVALNQPHAMVFHGDLPRFEQALTKSSVLAKAAVVTAEPFTADRDKLLEQTHEFLQQLLADFAKIPAHRLNEFESFENYGIDSLMAIQLTEALEKHFGTLSKTLFFEYGNIDELAHYFIEVHSESLSKAIGISIQVEVAQAAVAPVLSPVNATVSSDPMQAKSESPAFDQDIAIIGLSVKLPEADDMQTLWKNLKEGRDSITEIPQERWDHSLYFAPYSDDPGKTNSKWGGFINGVDQFDPLFFNISPREAEIIDPQERLFLQSAYSAIEDAGYTRSTLTGTEHFADQRNKRCNVGVFVGVMYQEYQLYGAQDQKMGGSLAIRGNSSSIANRVSYFCNFSGPSLAIDTMCSSSLTAIHMACQSLMLGECEVAIAGGVNVIVHPNKYLMLSQGNFVSSQGRCEAFGEGGDGYVPSEGVGAVVLKPKNQAISDGDHIYGLIKGSAINHGGKTNGYTVPNPNAQMEVIQKAHRKAGVDPRTISYIEAHGTGTSLGDPIEITGLSKAFRKYTQDSNFCAIGSVKSNLGHGESAAGIAGLAKVLMQIKHRQLVPSLHSAVINKNIDFANTPFVVQQQLADWPRPVVQHNGADIEYPRIAGISSFGAGGSNAHLVIEELSETETPNPALGVPLIFVFSGKNSHRLEEVVGNMIAAIDNGRVSDCNLADCAFTLSVGREFMDNRLAVIADSTQQLRNKLSEFLRTRSTGNQVFYGEVRANRDVIGIFSKDDEMRDLLKRWQQQNKVAKLLELWVVGYPLLSNFLLPNQHCRRMSLPTYPFSRDKYWFSTSRSVNAQSTTPSLAEKKVAHVATNPEALFMTKDWVPQSVTQSTSAPRRSVLVLAADTNGALVTELTRRLSNVTAISITQLPQLLVSGVIHWSQYDGYVDLSGLSNETGNEWLYCLQQLIESGEQSKLTLLGLTQGLEGIQPGQQVKGSLQAGLYRMLQSEHGQLQARHIDVDSRLNVAETAAVLVNELEAASEHTQIRYIDQTRHVSQLIPMQASAANYSQLSGKAVVITGGTRGIGLRCARHLVECHNVRRLVLMGRENLPPHHQWQQYLTMAEGNVTSGGMVVSVRTQQKLRDLLALEQLGTELMILSTPLDDRAALKQDLFTIKNRFGAVGAVLHCAGFADTDNPSFVRKTDEDIKRVFTPKVQGTDNLKVVFANEPLQFMLLFSSVSAVFPKFAAGHSLYAMVNGYLDYVAMASAETFPVISVQWPNWKESGMGEVKSNVYQSSGLLSLSDNQALSLFDSVIGGKYSPVVMPAMVDRQYWQPQQLLRVSKKDQGETIQIERKVGATITVREIGSQSIEGRLLALFSKELKIDQSQLDRHSDFQDWGVDSVIISQLSRQIDNMLKEPLAPTVLFEYSTLEKLSQYLASNHEFVTSEALPHAPVFENQPVTSVFKQPVASTPVDNLDIAIVGMSCRFAGAEDLEQYWQLLGQGSNAISRVSPARWQDSKPRFGGMIEAVDAFDYEFFMLPMADVKAMDPQALLLLEESLNLFSHAGYSNDEIKGSTTGVYIGARSNHTPKAEDVKSAVNPILAVGQNYLAANICQFFDLNGPAMVLDTACSSALVGLNMAVKSLQQGEISAAVVGGVNLLNDNSAHQMFEQRGILSPDDQFHILDSRAGGQVLGEGAGMILVKTMDQARRDNDKIYAVVKSVVVNNDGRTAGPATPNIDAQRSVLSAGLGQSGLQPQDIDYIEVNGAGNEISDLMELKAIGNVYGSTMRDKCYLGSVKPNIGHTLCAEGIAGLIKVALMLDNQTMVPFSSGQHKMKFFDIDNSSFGFCRNRQPWQKTNAVAALNCFADGGTNVHVVMQNVEQNNIEARRPIQPPILQKRPIRAWAAPAPAIKAGVNPWKKMYR